MCSTREKEASRNGDSKERVDQCERFRSRMLMVAFLPLAARVISAGQRIDDQPESPALSTRNGQYLINMCTN